VATNLWKFGYPTTADYIDLPEPQVGGATVSMLEVGGSARSRNGTLLVHRTGPVKRSYSFTHDPNNPALEWEDFLRLYQAYPGPFELYDPTVPNLLSEDDRAAVGWVTATGTPQIATNMRLGLTGGVTSVQTAITTAPAAANLTACLASTQYTLSVTVESQSSFAGQWTAYGYTSTPSGTGTIQTPGVALSANGRYTTTITTGVGIVYLELRATRSAGTANICDANLWYGANDPGRSLRSVAVRSFTFEVPSLNDGNTRANISTTMEEV
jgi:hypothetical protein